GTSIHAIANPVAHPATGALKSADGNGMAVLNIMRAFMGDFVQGRNLQPGKYNLYKEMGPEMFSAVFGAGKSTRNPMSTQRGKFNLFMMMERFFHKANGMTEPSKLEEVLSVIKSLLEATFPRAYEGHPEGGFMLLYGDAFVTINPKILREHFAK